MSRSILRRASRDVAVYFPGQLLVALAGALGQPAGTGLTLPGGLVLSASGRPAQLTVRTDPPFAFPGPAGGPNGSVAVELELTLADVNPAMAHLRDAAAQQVIDAEQQAASHGAAVARQLRASA